MNKKKYRKKEINITILKEDIFKHDDIVSYLKAWYRKNKKKDFHFSYRYLQKRLELKSSGNFFLVVTGEINLSPRMMDKLPKIMALSDAETDYFKILSHLSKSKLEKRLRKNLVKAYKQVFIKRDK